METLHLTALPDLYALQEVTIVISVPSQPGGHGASMIQRGDCCNGQEHGINGEFWSICF